MLEAAIYHQVRTVTVILDHSTAYTSLWASPRNVDTSP
jgi:hypothetical protein